MVSSKVNRHNPLLCTSVKIINVLPPSYYTKTTRNHASLNKTKPFIQNNPIRNEVQIKQGKRYIENSYCFEENAISNQSYDGQSGQEELLWINVTY